MRQVDEIGKRLAMPVRGFPWLGPVLKSHRQHFIEFCGWDGEIYVKDRGILSFTEYYRYILKQGFCLMIDGVIVGPVFISVHYRKRRLKAHGFNRGMKDVVARQCSFFVSTAGNVSSKNHQTLCGISKEKGINQCRRSH